MNVAASFAKSSKSSLSSCAKPFVVGEFILNTKLKTPKLISCDMDASNFRIMDDLDKLYYGNYFLEVCHLSTHEHIIDLKHYKLITQIISRLNGIENELLPMMRLTYLVKLMQYSGHGALLKPSCSRCGVEDSNYYFNVVEGQFQCMKCTPNHINKISHKALSLLKYIEETPLETLEKTKIHKGYFPALIELYEKFFLYQFQVKKIHSQDFIDHLL